MMLDKSTSSRLRELRTGEHPEVTVFDTTLGHRAIEELA